MKGPADLLETEGRWRTKMGASFPGKRVVFRGKDLFTELEHLSWMQLYLYGITGRIFTESQGKLFEGMWVLSTSYPDPRIWNNRIGSLAGTVRSTGNLAISASIAVSEASIYGRRPDIRAINFLLRARRHVSRSKTLQHVIEMELAQHRTLAGYGRPVVKSDERIKPLHQLAQNLQLADGPYVKLAFDINDVLQTGRWRMHMNVAALAAALAADQGLSEREFYLFAIPSFIAGIAPCFIEANEHKEGIFLPIRTQHVAYTGVEKRIWE